MQPQQGQDGRWYIQGAGGQWQVVDPAQFSGHQALPPQWPTGGQQQPPQQWQPQQNWQQPQQPPQHFAPQGYQPPPVQTPAGTRVDNNLFYNLDGADPSGGSRNPVFLPGQYRVELGALKLINTRKGTTQLIIEAVVLESSVPDRPPGTRCSGFINMSNVDTRDRNVKRFLCAVLGANPQEDRWKGPVAPDGRSWQANMWEALDDSNPWRGRRLDLNAYLIETDKGDDFTVLGWEPLNSLTIISPLPANTNAGAYAPPSGASGAQIPMGPPAAASLPSSTAAAAGGPPGFAPQGMPGQAAAAAQGAPPGYAPQGMPPQGPPPGYAPQGMPPQGPPQQPGFAPPGMPAQPGFAPQGAPPGFAPQGAPPQQPPGYGPPGYGQPQFAPR